MCKKRLAELRNDDLFAQPDSSHWGECPICCLPLPLDHRKSALMECCSKYICNGCDYANQKREFEAGLEKRCAFCREPFPKSKEEANKLCMKRIKRNDPVAMCQMGRRRYYEGDYETAFKYFTKAAELGDAMAHEILALMYKNGDGVEKDMKKAIYHWEEAAIAGHPGARHSLGCIDAINDRFEGAKKHFIIAANLGYEKSPKALRQLYAEGHASKEDYAGALRACQDALDATKSLEREKAEDAVKSGNSRPIG
jgi:TPR repeat protein